MDTGHDHNCRDNQRTRSDIEAYGLSVILIEASGYLPSFAYSIGLWQKFNHPEIIAFGLSIKTLHEIVNIAADIVKAGKVIELEVANFDIFKNGRAEFIRVDEQNIADYFGYAIEFYHSRDFPAIQLVWTDRNDKFPWDTGFEEEFIYRQPLLDRNMEFKFREAKNLTTFTTRQWIEQKKPILSVVHDSDGDWQFLTGDQLETDIRIVALEQLILRDKTLNEVFNLGYGASAERDYVGGAWIRTKTDYDDEE